MCICFFFFLFFFSPSLWEYVSLKLLILFSISMKNCFSLKKKQKKQISCSLNAQLNNEGPPNITMKNVSLADAARWLIIFKFIFSPDHIGSCICLTWKVDQLLIYIVLLCSGRHWMTRLNSRRNRSNLKYLFWFKFYVRVGKKWSSLNLIFSTFIGWVKRYAWGCKMEKITRLDHLSIHVANFFLQVGFFFVLILLFS